MGRQKTQKEENVEVLKTLIGLGLKLIELHNPTKMGCSCGQKMCGSPGKHPIKRDWQKRGWITDASVAASLLSGNRNTGVLTGAGLIVIDVDDKHNGGVSLSKLEQDYQPLPSTFTVKTGGGWHYYYKYDPSIRVPNSVGKLGEGIDIRADGGYVVAPPSLHANGERYNVCGGVDYIADAPQWLLDEAIRKKERPKTEGDRVSEGNRNQHLTSIAGSLRKNGLGERAIREAILIANQEQCVPPLPEDEVRSIAKSIASYPVEGELSWKELLDFDRNGRVIRSESNCIVMLSKSDEFKGCLEYDQFTGRGKWIKQPNSQFVMNKLGPDYDPDIDYAEVQNIISKEYGVTMPRGILQDALYATMKRNARDILREHVESFVWDGKPRLDNWLVKYAKSENDEYHRVVGRKFLISAVARALQPGCKVDYMLILESEEQGMGKSTMVNILGGQFYDDGSIETKSRDFMLKLRSAWFFEVSELSGFRRGQVESLKAFISDSHDSYREPYGRYNVVVPRRCVFVGTTNETHYLQDSENRRFWPVRVGRVSLDKLRRDRDQLIAEAREMYRAGEAWWPTQEMQRLVISPQQEKRRDVYEDPWTDILRDFVKMQIAKGETFISNEAVWTALNVHPNQRTGFVGQRIGRCMLSLGWNRCRDGERRGFRLPEKVSVRNEPVQKVSEEPPSEVPGKPGPETEE